MVIFEKVNVVVVRTNELKCWLKKYELLKFAHRIANMVLDMNQLEVFVATLRPHNMFTYNHKNYVITPLMIFENLHLKNPLKKQGKVDSTTYEFMEENFKEQGNKG